MIDDDTTKKIITDASKTENKPQPSPERRSDATSTTNGEKPTLVERLWTGVFGLQRSWERTLDCHPVSHDFEIIRHARAKISNLDSGL